MKRKKPLRKCVVTGEVKEKRELIRVVRDPDGFVFVDHTGKKNGRGAYLTDEEDWIMLFTLFWDWRRVLAK